MPRHTPGRWPPRWVVLQVLGATAASGMLQRGNSVSDVRENAQFGLPENEFEDVIEESGSTLRRPGKERSRSLGASRWTKKSPGTRRDLCQVPT